MKAKTKTERLIALMKRQWVSPITALEKCSLLSLSQRVSLDIGPAHRVAKRWAVSQDGARYMEYRILGGK